MTSPVTPRKKLSITKILIAAFLLLMVFVCGGGYLYVDYHSGSLSSTFLPEGQGKPRMKITAHTRGFLGGGTGLNGSGPTIELSVGDQVFTVSRDSVRHQDKELVKLPANTSDLEIEGYRGKYRVIADGSVLTSVTVETNQ